MNHRNARTAFTLVELLVVIGIIAVLAGLLIVGVGAATRKAQLANTRFLMTSMVQAMARFKADHGYYPPVLGDPGALIVSPPGVKLGWIAGPTRSAGPQATVGAGGQLVPGGQVGWMRDLLTPPVKAKSTPTGTTKADQWKDEGERTALQRWHSITSPAEYLIGPGDRSTDGYGICGTLPEIPPTSPKPGQREVPAGGIRSPGSDGVWGAALTPVTVQEIQAAGIASSYGGREYFKGKNTGTFGARNLAVPSRGLVSGTVNEQGNDDMAAIARCQMNIQGRVFGPYLELKDASTLGGIRGIRSVGTDGQVEYDVVRANEGDPNFELYPKCIVDYWGTPIRYYRRGYAGLTPSAPDASTDGTAFDLGDFFALRPTRADEADFVPTDEATRECLADPSGDRSATRRLRAAEIGLMSAGPDRRVDLSRRVAASGPNGGVNVNEDNLVETGP